MRYFFNIITVLVIGLAGGGLSAWWAVKTDNGFGSVKIGEWVSWPLAGSVDADPYTKARVAKNGTVPLGAAEGLAFHRSTDQFGKLLKRECYYVIEGATPPARMWTLSVQDGNKRDVAPTPGGIGAMFSQTILRGPDGTFNINIGRSPAPGNWLSVSGAGPMRLVIRLYDTPITSSAGLVEPVMPKLVNKGCSV